LGDPRGPPAGTQWYAPDIEIATAKGRELGVRNLRISGEFTVDSGRSQELEPEPGSSEPYVDPTEFAFTVKLHVMNAEDDPPEAGSGQCSLRVLRQSVLTRDLHIQGGLGARRQGLLRGDEAA